MGCTFLYLYTGLRLFAGDRRNGPNDQSFLYTKTCDKE